MDNFYIFLSSSDSKQINSTNKPHDFTVVLPQSISFNREEGTEWTVALADIAITNQGDLTKTILVFCDIVSPSLIRGSYNPVLRSFPSQTLKSTSLFLPYYLPVNSSLIERIRIYLVDDKLKPITFDESKGDIELTCSLHFQMYRH